METYHRPRLAWQLSTPTEQFRFPSLRAFRETPTLNQIPTSNKGFGLFLSMKWKSLAGTELTWIKSSLCWVKATWHFTLKQNQKIHSLYPSAVFLLRLEDKIPNPLQATEQGPIHTGREMSTPALVSSTLRRKGFWENSSPEALNLVLFL